MELKYPKGEKLWVRYYDEEHELRFIVTSKGNNRELYYLYKVAGDSFERIGKSPSPVELERKYVKLTAKKG